MASRKTPQPDGGTIVSPRIIMGAVAVAIISAVSSFIAIRFALPKQIIVEQRVIHETPKPERHGAAEGHLWNLRDPFIVNIADPSGRHFLKTSVSIKLEKNEYLAPVVKSGKEGKEGEKEGEKKGADTAKAIADRMRAFEPMFRDRIIHTLQRQTQATLFDQERVKQEISVALNVLAMEDENIPKTLAVYFSDFVVQ